MTGTIDSEALAWDKQNGLLPVIVQDAHTLRVLMLGYMNRDALASSSSLRRRWPMWTSTRCSSPTQVCPQTASMSWRLV